ncbi:MAG: VCBS repeat-containing protein [Verrucomicrobiales bacterium]|nr:VCBS repeat-containing protein [Verrucomicrobiales bacterium]
MSTDLHHSWGGAGLQTASWRRALVLALALAGAFALLVPVAAPAAVTPLSVSATGHPGFTRLAPEATGLNFTNRLSDLGAASNQIRLNGSGVALADIDRDGRLDVFLCGLESSNRLFRNLGGWRFEALESSPGLALPGSYATGAAFADVDGDGDSDLLVNALGEGTRLFLNDGAGRFAERTDAGLMRRGGASSLALADIDGDGDLDLYVANYRTQTVRTTGIPMVNVGGQRTIPPQFKDDLELTPEGRVLEHGEPDLLYLNLGDGRFQLEPWTQGRFLDEDGRPLAKTPRDWGLAAAFRDLNQDGLPDLYVCNDFHSEDRVWINLGRGRFRAAPRLALRNSATFSMCVDFADLNRDGWDDFFVSDMLDRHRERRMHQLAALSPLASRIGVYDDRPQYGRNVLQVNRGDGTFAELAHFAGLERSGWTWGAAFLDVDLDGFEDLLLTTGHLFNIQDLDAAAQIERQGPYRRDQIPGKLLKYPKVAWPKLAFRNEGHLGFTESGVAWGFADAGVAHGLALGDLDGDGDLDVVVNDLNRAAGLYRNEAHAPRVLVQLRGPAPNSDGIGARVSLVTPQLVQSQEIQCGARYLSCDAPQRTFAWPSNATLASLVVHWPDGQSQILDGIQPNQQYLLVHTPSASPAPPTTTLPRHPPLPPGEPWFIETSTLLNHRHTENLFDDFQRQPLLPFKLSQPGPALAWCDLNQDGRDDLAIGGAAGGHLAAFLNSGRGTFERLPNATTPAPAPLARDVTGIVTAPDHPGRLWIALSNHEDAQTNLVALREWQPIPSPANPVDRDLLADLPDAGSAGILAVADADGDGDLDAFIGGRSMPGRYPAPASSLILRQDAGRFLPDPATRDLLTHAGLVTGALWSDLDLDGSPELVLACEWGPLRILQRRGTQWAWLDPELQVNTANARRLSDWTGLWTTLASGDFDGDGRPDLLAGNFGRNSPTRPTPEHPARLHYGDFDESGSVDLVEASFDPELGQEGPDRDLLSLQQAVPSLVAKFASHTAWSKVGTDDLLSGLGTRVRRLGVVTVDTCLLLNRGARWELVRLPDAAQFAPAMGAAIADFDGNGTEDVFLAQNFFPVQPLASRQDAGLGLLLRNDGHGRFTTAGSALTGLSVFGESRSCAVADYDLDGRTDLVVSQNGAETRLFRNRHARPGLRVTLRGPAGNPHGIGARIRVRQGTTFGPSREVQSGSGGLAQNSPYVVLARGSEATGLAGELGLELEVTWPGGQRTTTLVPVNAASVIVTHPGPTLVPIPSP